jgi:preprotein translocase subunit SecA
LCGGEYATAKDAARQRLDFLVIQLGDALTKVFGTSNERTVKRMLPTVQAISALEPAMQQLTDEQMRAKTDEFRARIAAAIADIKDSEERYKAEQDVLEQILPEAFALVREAGRRVINMRHFDVQLIGGMVLHQGNIAEMKTGEGKTLVATLPCYLNALAGHGVHVVTVNDYLAKRDAEWMGKIHNYLGLSVGVIVHDLSDEQRRAAYAADITYGTNNEFGFDYLRDNMKFELSECVQKPPYYAIVDEVDSILIDEARTPLIISGPTDQTTDKYARVVRIVPQLELGEEIESLENKVLTGDYVVDEKHRTIGVTDEGWVKIEGLLGIESIADPENWDLKHYVETAIKAHALYKRDVNYVVKDGEIIIVDEFTGRLMPGRRWSDGLHQSIEAKEGVNIRREDQTLATITFQNYFRLYKKLSGMTGTADTEAAEFEKIYDLDVVVIPTNMPMCRIDNTDVVFRTAKEKYFAVADEIARLNESKQPVLVGTTSIEKSELLSQILQRKNIRHVVLNAKFHEREAEIVAQAGHIGMVTIATNMAGRGTDIVLGGNAEFLAKQELVKKNRARAVSAAEGEISPTAAPGMMRFYYQSQEFETPESDWKEVYAGYAAQVANEREEVLAAGGLIILGTERHESRRVDNQLRGRAGRQGDPGASRFFLSLEDDLMRIFAKEWVSTLLQRLGMEEGVPIESKLITRRIEAAQKAVEGQNFESRKHVLEYDDVMNKQREAVYGTRRQLLEGIDQKELITDDYVSNILSTILDTHAPDKLHPDQWDIKALQDAVLMQFGMDITAEGIPVRELNRHELGEALFTHLKERYDAKEQIIGAQAMRYHERMIMLSVLDGLWKDHLLAMDQLKEGIGLRGYGQQDPLISYKRESFEAFEAMMNRFQEDTVRFLFRMQIMGPDGKEISIPARVHPQSIVFSGGSATAADPGPAALPGSVGGNNGAGLNGGSSNGVASSIPVPTRAPSTTIDSLEEEFQRRKKRELQQARMAGAGEATETAQRRTGDKVGRNDPCPCGSGKKFKKCHGVDA